VPSPAGSASVSEPLEHVDRRPCGRPLSSRAGITVGDSGLSAGPVVAGALEAASALGRRMTQLTQKGSRTIVAQALACNAGVFAVERLSAIHQQIRAGQRWRTRVPRCAWRSCSASLHIRPESKVCRRPSSTRLTARAPVPPAVSWRSAGPHPALPIWEARACGWQPPSPIQRLDQWARSRLARSVVGGMFHRLRGPASRGRRDKICGSRKTAFSAREKGVTGLGE